MTESNSLLLIVLSLSIVFQFAAAILAIRLIRPSGVYTAWVLLACGFVLQGVRRIVSLVYVLKGDLQGDLTVASLGLTISVLMLLGIAKFRPLFEEINRSHRALRAEHRQLEISNRELEAFVATASHDLRNPLTAIIGFSEQLQMMLEKHSDDQVRLCVDEIERQGNRMAALLSDLLTLAQLGHIDRPDQDVDSNRILDETLGEFARQMEDAGVRVIRAPLPAMPVPETFLAEVFKNLIGNALSYAGNDDRRIEIGGIREGQAVKLFVRDHGPGIPVNERERVFEMFYRGSTSVHRNGTGIGLAIVAKIAQMYEGQAWVEETPGGGCTFWFEVACANISPALTPEPPHTPTP